MLVEFRGLRRYGKGRNAYYAIRLGKILRIRRWGWSKNSAYPHAAGRAYLSDLDEARVGAPDSLRWADEGTPQSLLGSPA
jgi:hypothetical protein